MPPPPKKKVFTSIQIASHVRLIRANLAEDLIPGNIFSLRMRAIRDVTDDYTYSAYVGGNCVIRWTHLYKPVDILFFAIIWHSIPSRSILQEFIVMRFIRIYGALTRLFRYFLNMNLIEYNIKYIKCITFINRSQLITIYIYIYMYKW